MSVNPYPNLPHDKGNNVMQNVVPTASIKAIRVLEQGTISSVYSLTPDTTFIEIAALTVPAAMRWVRTGDGEGSVVTIVAGANFEHIIPAGRFRQFAVPIEKMYQAPSSMVGANVQNGLYTKVAVKSLLAAGSVMLTEF